MRNIKTSSAIIAFVMILNIILLYFAAKFRTEKTTDEYSLSLFKDKNVILENSLNTLKLSSYFQFATDYTAAKIVLHINSNKTSLIVRVHSNNCNECVNNSVKILEQHNTNNILPITVIADYPDLKAFKSDFPEIEKKFPVIIQNTIATDLPKNSYPYIFVYNPVEKSATHFIYPNWQLMDLFQQYVTLLK